MNCEEARPLVDLWVDGELGEELRRTLESHAASCPGCARHLQFARHLKELVARKARRPEPPAWLADRVRRAVAAGARGRRIPGLATGLGATLVAAGVLVAGWSVWSRGGPDSFSRALAADHARYLARADAAELSTADPVAIEAWFEGRLPFETKLPGLAAQPLGARRCRILDRPCALVFYEKEGCRLSLFVFDPASLPAPLPETAIAEGFNLLGWDSRGLRYALVSDLPRDAMRGLRKEG